MIEVHSLRTEVTCSCKFSLDTEGQGACLLLFYLDDVCYYMKLCWSSYFMVRGTALQSIHQLLVDLTFSISSSISISFSI